MKNPNDPNCYSYDYVTRQYIYLCDDDENAPDYWHSDAYIQACEESPDRPQNDTLDDIFRDEE